MSDLTTRTLDELETVIDTAFDHFSDVVSAFAEIRNRELYRPEYSAFAEYLRVRWHSRYQKSQAHKVIGAIETVLALPGEVRVENAHQADMLKRVEESLRPAVAGLLDVAKEANGGKLSARAIAELTDVVREAVDTGTIELADDGQVPIGVLQAVGVSLTEEVAERLQRQAQYIRERQNGREPLWAGTASVIQVIEHIPGENPHAVLTVRESWVEVFQTKDGYYLKVRKEDG